jgi:hypothetical protein
MSGEMWGLGTVGVLLARASNGQTRDLPTRDQCITRIWRFADHVAGNLLLPRWYQPCYP